MKRIKLLLGVHAILAVATVAFLYAVVTKTNEALTIIDAVMRL